MDPNYKIYIVDKCNDNLRLISKQLENALSCKTKVFERAEDCLNYLKFETPHLILIDQNVGVEEKRLRGNQLANKIKKKYKDQISVVLFSSKCSMKNALSMIKNGVNDVIPEKQNERSTGKQIVQSSRKQIKKIRDKSREKNAKIFILSTIILILGAFLYLDYSAQHWLPYFAAAFLAISILTVFLSAYVRNIFIGRNYH